MWDFLLGVASVVELSAIGVYLGLVELRIQPLFWAVVGCASIQPAVYYIIAVRFACCSRSYPNPLEKALNVIYLYSLYIECIITKREPKSSADQFDYDGMIEMNDKHRKQMLIFHGLTVTCPVLGMYIYNSIEQGFGLIEWICLGAMAVAALLYIAFLVSSAKIPFNWRLNRSYDYLRDSRFLSL